MSLFTTINELMEYDSVLPTLSLSRIKPYIESAEKKFIVKAIGKEQYMDLLDAYENSILVEDPVPLSQPNKDLLHYCRRALAQLTLYMSANTLDVQVSDSGIRRKEDVGNKSAYQYQINDYKRSKLDLGVEMLSELIVFVEENIDDYTHYASSPEHTRRSRMFVFNHEVFTEAYTVEMSAYVFRVLEATLRQVQRFQILPIIGVTRHEELITQMNAGSLTEENEALLELIRNAITRWAMVLAIKHKAVDFNQSGITVVMPDGSRTVDARMSAEIQRLNDIQAADQAQLDEFIEKIQNLINPSEAPAGRIDQPESGAYAAI